MLKFINFFGKLIYFNWRLITLQYCSGFCHTLTWISHGCTCVPHPELFPHPIPQGHPSAPALSALSHASNLDWRSILHMVIYMFQCCSLKSSHPRLLPQSPKVCSFHLCLFCCHSYHLSKFHIYALIYCIGNSSIFTLCLLWFLNPLLCLRDKDSLIFFLCLCYKFFFIKCFFLSWVHFFVEIILLLYIKWDSFPILSELLSLIPNSIFVHLWIGYLCKVVFFVWICTVMVFPFITKTF